MKIHVPSPLRFSIPALALSTVLGVPAAAQAMQITTLFEEGDPLVPGADVNFFLHATGNSHRQWSATLVSISTPVTPSTNEFLVAQGVPLLRENDSVVTPAGPGKVDNFLPESDSNMSDGGDVITRVELDPPVGVGLFLNDDMLVFGHSTGGSPADVAGFPANSTYKGLSGARINTARQVLFSASIGTTSSSIALVRVQATESAELGEQVPVATVGEVKPGLSGPIQAIGISRNDMIGLNEQGQALYSVSYGANQSAILLDDQLLLQSGTTEPVTGAVWTQVFNTPVALNDSGDWAVLGGVAGGVAENQILAVNGSALVRKGQTLPDIEPYVIIDFMGTAVEMDEDGNVAWMGRISHPQLSMSECLFLNDQLLVQTGVTEVGGRKITSLLGGALLFGSATSHDLSPDGRFLYVLADVGVTQSALLLLSPEATVTPMSECIGNTGQISVASGVPAIGTPFTLALDNAQNPGAVAVTWLSILPIATWPGTGCGVALPGIGELLIDILPPNPIATFVDVWDGSPVELDLQFPNAVGFVGFDLYAQGIFSEPTTLAEPLRLTGGLALSIGDTP